MKPLILGCVALLLTGCGGGTMDTPKIENAIQAQYKDKGYEVTVDCPDGIKADPGRTFHCIVTDENSADNTVRMAVTIENSDGDVTWKAEND